MSTSITINGITGTSPYNITLCDTDPVSPTCVWIAQITSSDLPYTFTPPISLQYTTSFLVKIVDSGFPCTIIIPPILITLNPCYPIYVDATNNEVYSFDPSSYATSSYFDPGVQIDAMTRNDDKIWIYDSNIGFIYEYDATGYTTPTVIRQIDTIANSIDIYGMCVFSSSTELLALSSTGDVNVIDISTNISSITTTLYNISGTPQNDCNLLRDDNIGITYLKTSSSGLKAFYDDGTQYSTATWPSGNQKGFFRDSLTAEIYGVNDTGVVYQIPQPPGTISPTSSTTISPDNLVSVGLGQSNSCSPAASSLKVSLNNATAYTMNFTASSFTWINWGDSDYVSGGTSGLITRSKTYSPAFTGDVTLNSYNLASITGIRLLDSLPINIASPTIDTTQLSGLTNLSNYTTQSYPLTKGLVGYLPDSINYFDVISSSLTGDTSDLPTGMTYCSLGNSLNTLTGNVVNLPINLEVMFISGQLFSGNTSGFPSNLVWLRLDGGDTISGSTFGLPPNLKYLYLATSSNTISGSTSGLPSTLSHIHLGGNNTVSGDTSGLPRVDFSFVPENNNAYVTPTVYIGGYNTISGDVSGLPPEVRNLDIIGYNTISGDTSGLPRSGNTTIYGFNTISGDISGLPNLASAGYESPRVTISGNNTISGDTSGLNGNISYFTISQTGGDGITTGNTISGNISGFTGTSLVRVHVAGANTISGNTSNIPTTISFNTILLYGNNTLTGDITNIPSNITELRLFGQNTVGGNISGLTTSTLRYFDVGGNNTISGGFSGFPTSPGILVFSLSGGSIDLTPGSASGMALPSGIGNFTYLPTGSGLSSADVDSILFAATAQTSWVYPSNGYPRSIDLRGANSTPTAASLAARLALTGSPYNLAVYTN
jgi:hypothetical protein